MSNSVDDFLLDRYLAGECAPAERVHVEEKVANDVIWARRVEEIRTLREMTHRLPQPWDADALWRAMQVRRTAGARVVNGDRRASWRSGEHRARARVGIVLPHGERAPTFNLLRVAAGIMIAASLAGLWYGSSRWQPAQTKRYRIEAQRGRLTTARLADGSRVTLAAGSVLDVPQTFDPRGRDVLLVGQAYFEIAHDSARPFRVHTRNTVTRVLGTKFELRAYPEDSGVTVMVTEGRVAFGADPVLPVTPSGSPGGVAAVALTRGDRARLDPRGQLRVEHGVAVDRELAWMQGRLVFVDTPLATVVREIERWYDVHIVVADASLNSAPVSASFGNESIADVLQTLAISLDAQLERHGDTVSLRAGR